MRLLHGAGSACRDRLVRPAKKDFGWFGVQRPPTASLLPIVARNGKFGTSVKRQQDTSLAAAAKEPRVQNGKGLARSFLLLWLTPR
jgi:hypothetical protein